MLAWRNPLRSVSGSTSASYLKLSPRAIDQRLCESLKLGLAGFRNRVAAGIEFQVGKLFSAPEKGAQQRKWRRHRLGDQVDDDLDNDAADRKLRIVERSADRQIDVDDAVAVAQQRHRKHHRKLGRGRAFNLLAEC